jgi:predicted PurR-regulated permease PerM
MTRPERLLLLVFFAGLLALLAYQERNATAVGGVAGAVAGVAVAGRVRRLSRRMDERLGIDDPAPARRLRPRALAVRAVVHLAVLAALLASTVFVPFVGDELFAGSAAAVTALPAVLTAAGLRRRARRAGRAR